MNFFEELADCMRHLGNRPALDALAEAWRLADLYTLSSGAGLKDAIPRELARQKRLADLPAQIGDARVWRVSAEGQVHFLSSVRPPIEDWLGLAWPHGWRYGTDATWAAPLPHIVHGPDLPDPEAVATEVLALATRHRADLEAALRAEGLGVADLVRLGYAMACGAVAWARMGTLTGAVQWRHARPESTPHYAAGMQTLARSVNAHEDWTGLQSEMVSQCRAQCPKLALCAESEK